MEEPLMADQWRKLGDDADELPAEWQWVLGYTKDRDPPLFQCRWYRHAGSGAVCWDRNGLTGAGVRGPDYWMPNPEPPR
jgi:hypothetical protein